jgi:hypothetical protein
LVGLGLALLAIVPVPAVMARTTNDSARILRLVMELLPAPTAGLEVANH